MNNINKASLGYIYVALAALCWGTIGVFVEFLSSMGISAETIVFSRSFTGFLVLFVLILLTKPKQLLISKKGLLMTAFMGLATQTAFNISYFYAIKAVGVASAAVLLYVAPLFLLIWSVVIFKEALNIRKIAGVTVCMSGSVLAITGGDLSVLQVSAFGVTMGLLAALCYSLMTVFSKIAMKKIEPLTIILYSFLFGAIFIVPFIPKGDIIKVLSSKESIGLAVGIGLVPSSLAYFLYFKGISSGIDIAKAGVICTLELILSIILALIVFKEPLGLVKILGIVTICFAILIMEGEKINTRTILNKFKKKSGKGKLKIKETLNSLK